MHVRKDELGYLTFFFSSSNDNYNANTENDLILKESKKYVIIYSLTTDLMQH